MNFNQSSIGALLAASLFLSACAASPNYAERETDTQRAGDAAFRYGTTAAVGAGAGAATYGITKNTGESVAVGSAASLAMLGVHKINDSGKVSAYNIGVIDGAASVRAEILNEKWRREAILGVSDDSQNGGRSSGVTRRVWVPAREVNGIVYEGKYQEVKAYP